MRTQLAIILLAATALGACAHKKKPLPPTPPAIGATTTAPATPGGAASGSGADAIKGTTVPGSRENLVEVAGADHVLFGLDSYELDETAKGILTAQAAWLLKYPKVRATVEGHCDERGSREYNLALGERRANAAKTFLAAQGVDAGRLTVLSYGKERPAAEGSDEPAYAQNRRAVTVVPESPAA